MGDAGSPVREEELRAVQGELARLGAKVRGLESRARVAGQEEEEELLDKLAKAVEGLAVGLAAAGFPEAAAAGAEVLEEAVLCKRCGAEVPPQDFRAHFVREHLF